MINKMATPSDGGTKSGTLQCKAAAGDVVIKRTTAPNWPNPLRCATYRPLGLGQSTVAEAASGGTSAVRP